MSEPEPAVVTFTPDLTKFARDLKRAAWSLRSHTTIRGYPMTNQAPATTEDELAIRERFYTLQDHQALDRIMRSLSQLRAERDEAVQALREIERDEHTGVLGPLHDGFLVDGCSGCIARHFLFLHQGPP